MYRCFAVEKSVDVRLAGQKLAVYVGETDDLESSIQQTLEHWHETKEKFRLVYITDDSGVCCATLFSCCNPEMVHVCRPTFQQTLQVKYVLDSDGRYISTEIAQL